MNSVINKIKAKVSLDLVMEAKNCAILFGDDVNG